MTIINKKRKNRIKNKTNTRALCPECGILLEADRYTRGKSVYMARTCPEHGPAETLLSTNPKLFSDTTFDVEGLRVARPLPSRGSCPSDCGFCGNHKQHICTGLIEITGMCNLSCPICFTEDKEKVHISFEEFKSRLEALIQAEHGELGVLQISGGEPLVHPEFARFLEYAVSRNITRVLINTNGLLLEREDIFKTIRHYRDRAEVYLQFDGFNREVITDLRGKDLLDVKLRILEKLDKADIRTTLAVTVPRDNLSGIAPIMDLAVDTGCITGVTFQRLFRSGGARHYHLESVCHDEIIEKLIQTEYFARKDIIPLPCSHRNCTFISFLFCTEEKSEPLSRFFRLDRNKDLISNRLAFDQTIIEYAKGKICDCVISKTLKKPAGTLRKLKTFFMNSTGSRYENMKVLRIVVKNFMDADTFDAERVQKCCVGVSTGKGRIIPFCVYNNIHRNAE